MSLDLPGQFWLFLSLDAFDDMFFRGPLGNRGVSLCYHLAELALFSRENEGTVGHVVNSIAIREPMYFFEVSRVQSENVTRVSPPTVGKSQCRQNRSNPPRLQTQTLARKLQVVIHSVRDRIDFEGVASNFFSQVNGREKGPKDGILFGIQVLVRNCFTRSEQFEQRLRTAGISEVRCAERPQDIL